MEATAISLEALENQFGNASAMQPHFGGYVRSIIKTPTADMAQLLEIVHQLETPDAKKPNPEWTPDKDIRDMCLHYIAARIAERFPLIPEELFKLERWLLLNLENPQDWFVETDSMMTPPDTSDVHPGDRRKTPIKTWVKAPLIVTQRTKYLSSESTTQVCRFSNGAKVRGWVNARFPSKPPGATWKQRYECASILYSAISELLSHPTIAKYIYTEEGQSSSLFTFNTCVAWIPRTEEMVISRPTPTEDGDPIMYFLYKGKRFLIDAWEVTEEHPMQSLVNEFISQ